MTDQRTAAEPAIDGIIRALGLVLGDGLDLDGLDADANLFELGLDSITLMQLVGEWQRNGAEVTFADLADEPTLGAWARLLPGIDPAGSAPGPSPTAGSAGAGSVHSGTDGSGSGSTGPGADRSGSGSTRPGADRNGSVTSSPTVGGNGPASPGTDGAGDFPLALMQRSYWVGRSPRQPLGGVAAHLYCELDTPTALDPDRLAVAFDCLLARHGSLRTVVTEDGYQRVAERAGWAGLVVDDLRFLPAAEVEDRLAHRRDEWSHQMLDIEGGEMLAAAVSLLPDGRSRLHLDVDMVAADAVSYRLLLDELAALHDEPDRPLPELPATYRDCCAARTAHRRDRAGGAEAWWRDRLDRLPSGPRLPLVAEPAGPPRAARHHLHLDAGARDRLYGAARRRALTPAAVLATAFAEVVGAWSVAEPFLLNVPLFHRPAGELDASGVVGDFSSSVLVAVDVTAPAPFEQRAATLQADLHAGAARADHSGVEVLRDLTRRRGHQVLAPVVFTSALNLGELFGTRARTRFGDPVWIISQGPQVLLDAQVTELDGGILVNWDSRSSELRPGVVDAMFDAFRSLVEGLVADGDAWSTVAAGAFPADRDRATAPEAAPGTGAGAEPEPSVAPRTTLERAVALVWGEVLGIGADDLGVHDELFAVGGDSVLAATIVTHLREVFATPAVTIRSLFDAPTVAGLAATMAAAEPDQARLDEIADIYCEIATLSDDEVAAQLGEDLP